MRIAKSSEWLARSKAAIPGASQTYTKSYRYFTEGAAPAFIDRGKGGHVWDVDGNEFIDFVLALGAVTVGYNNTEINKAVQDQLMKGISFSQPTILEVELAEKLKKIIPSAEMVKFMKNGSDATTAAVRLARSFTGRNLVACCGYHGMQDWYVGNTINGQGVPDAVKALTLNFEYNNIESCKALLEEHKDRIAIFMLEPCQGDGPNNGFLQELKELCNSHGTLLAFDEVVSGFRVALGGAQQLYGVMPDLSAIGKGMANGLALSAVVGRRDIMSLIDERTFISSTFGGETLSLAGALATIKILERKESFPHIIGLGDLWNKHISKAIKERKLEASAHLHGVSPHCGVKFQKTGNLTDLELLTLYQQELLKRGILTIGINNFCLEHTEKDVMQYVKAAESALDMVSEAIIRGSVKGMLKGKLIRPIFRRE